MKKRFYGSFVTAALLICGLLYVSGVAQKPKADPSATSQITSDPLMSLPASDGVVSVDVQRLLSEMLPRVFADDPTRLAQVNARIDQIKTRTGIDVRMFDRVAVGMKLTDTAPDTLKAEAVVLARGSFNSSAMLAAGLIAANSKYKYQQQKYAGKTIYIFQGEELFGKDQLPQVAIGEEAKRKGGKAAEIADGLLQKLLNFKGDVAIVALDAHTLAIGQPARVRAAIDASSGRGRVNVALAQLATKTPNAVVGYGMNVPANASRYFGLDNDQLAANLNSIKQVYGAIASTDNGYEMKNFARTDTAAQAQGLYNTLIGFKDLGGFFVSSLSGDTGKLAQSALDNLKIVKEGTEVQIHLELAQADIAMLVRVIDKRK